jgi:hypothetical protein
MLPADEPGSAEALLRSLPKPGDDMGLNVNVLDTSEPAVALLDGLGFERREDPPWRMVLTAAGPGGDAGPGLSPRFFAIGPAAKG